MDEEKSLLIRDVLKLDDYIGFGVNSATKDKDRFNGESIETLQLLHDTYIKFLLDYKIMGKAYPSVLELLNIKSAEVINCIETHKEERQELQTSNSMRNFKSNNIAEDEYCESCHQVPCMCSDREKTSTTHDF